MVAGDSHSWEIGASAGENAPLGLKSTWGPASKGALRDRLIPNKWKIFFYYDHPNYFIFFNQTPSKKKTVISHSTLHLQPDMFSTSTIPNSKIQSVS
jgi:hypothetical protein